MNRLIALLVVFGCLAGCGWHLATPSNSTDAMETSVDALIAMDVNATRDDRIAVDEDASQSVMDAALEASHTDSGCDEQFQCNGVCVDFANDPLHCGSCGNNCSALPGVVAQTVQCTGGACNLTNACQSGRAHCSTNIADGCEADLSVTAHCGSCANACSTGQTCQSLSGVLTCVSPQTSCDPLMQNCPIGQECTIVTGGLAMCVAAGTVINGGACGGTAGVCARGNYCDMVTTTHGVCRQFCATDNDCTQDPASSGSTSEPDNLPECRVRITGSSVRACTVACNPVPMAGASGCPTGTACDLNVVNGSPTDISNCVAPRSGTRGATCARALDCAPGYSCLEDTTSGQCDYNCRAGHDSDCPSGEGCSTLGASSDSFGVCCIFGDC